MLKRSLVVLLSLVFCSPAFAWSTSFAQEKLYMHNSWFGLHLGQRKTQVDQIYANIHIVMDRHGYDR
jgi:hypothetical protein